MRPSGEKPGNPSDESLRLSGSSSGSASGGSGLPSLSHPFPKLDTAVATTGH